MLRLGHAVNAFWVDAQGATHIAQGRARAVRDDHTGERRTVAAVFAVDVLDDLFPALVFKVNVDVGRLVAFGADEALKKQAHARGVDLGHAQAITDRRVGRAAPALAQDALVARPVRKVSHGQKIGLVLELCNECQFMFEGGAHGAADACRKAFDDALFRQFAQPRGGRLPWGDDLFGVFITQLVQRKRAAPGQLQTGG